MKFSMYSGSALGINTKNENIVRRWAVKNGHEETAQPEADKIFYDSYSNTKDLYSVPDNLIDKYAPINKSWLYLHDGYEVSFKELIDLFNQANSRNAEVSRLALQLIYKLRGDKYLDIQRIVEKCGFPELKFCTEYDTYKSIRKDVYAMSDTDPVLSNLPLTALCSVQKNGVTNQEITVPFLNWILKEFSMFNNPKIKFEANVSYD